MILNNFGLFLWFEHMRLGHFLIILAKIFLLMFGFILLISFFLLYCRLFCWIWKQRIVVSLINKLTRYWKCLVWMILIRNIAFVCCNWSSMDLYKDFIWILMGRLIIFRRSLRLFWCFAYFIIVGRYDYFWRSLRFSTLFWCVFRMVVCIIMNLFMFILS